MKIECTEINGIKDHPYYPSYGDVISVPAEVGARWIAAGWAKNAATGETGERPTGAVDLDINNSAHVAKAMGV